MEVVDPKEFLSGGIFREQNFRDSVKTFDWSKFKDKPVLIQGCPSPLPIWAYLAIMGELTPFAKSISYGELKSPIPVSGKLGGGPSPDLRSASPQGEATPRQSPLPGERV